MPQDSTPQHNGTGRSGREEPVFKTAKSAKYLPACAKYTGGTVVLGLSDGWISYCRPDS